jgi:hypothetical protein
MNTKKDNLILLIGLIMLALFLSIHKVNHQLFPVSIHHENSPFLRNIHYWFMQLMFYVVPLSISHFVLELTPLEDKISLNISKMKKYSLAFFSIYFIAIGLMLIIRSFS